MMGAKTLEARIADLTAKLKGDAGVLKQFASTMVDFDPRFEIMPGTKSRETELVKANPYEAVPRETIAEIGFISKSWRGTSRMDAPPIFAKSRIIRQLATGFEFGKCRNANSLRRFKGFVTRVRCPFEPRNLIVLTECKSRSVNEKQLFATPARRAVDV